MSAAVQTIIRRDPAEVCEGLAEELRQIMAFGPEAESVSIALSGGSTPKQLYETLARAPHRDVIPWPRLEIFFGDERSVAPDHPDSNYRMAHEALLSKVSVRAHRMEAERGAAEAYEALVTERVAAGPDGVPEIDVVLLGVGDDGHTASLFPGTAALDEGQRLVVMNDVPRLETRRMTFTYRLLNAARRVWVIATGAGKCEIVRECLEALRAGRLDREHPVTGVRPNGGELVWWLDEAAAGESVVR